MMVLLTSTTTALVEALMASGLGRATESAYWLTPREFKEAQARGIDVDAFNGLELFWEDEALSDRLWAELEALPEWDLED